MRALAFAVCFLMAAVLAACTDAASNDTVLRFWAMGREGEVVKTLLPEFERTHPGVRVEVQQIPWSSAHEKLLTAYAGGSLPDVAQMGNTWLPEFAAIGALERLEWADVQAADTFSGIWLTNVIGDGVYGVPWYIDTRLLFYRRDVLAEAGYAAPPKTWAEWLAMLEAVKKRVGPDRYAVLLPLNEFEPLLVLALQQNAPLLSEDGARGNFESASFKRALAFYLDMFQRDLAPHATAAAIANVWSEFARSYFSFYISGPWNIGEFKRRLPAAQQANWMTAPMPGPNGPGLSVAGGASLVVFKGSAHKEAARELLAYLSRPDIEIRFHALTGDLPPRRSAWDDPSLASDVYARAFRAQLEQVRPAPKVPEWERIATEMRIVAEAMVAGKFTVDEAAAELNRRADRILEKRRWMLSRKEGV